MQIQPGDISWLVSIVLAAAQTPRKNASPTDKKFITSPKGNAYEILAEIGSNSRYTLYDCILPDGRCAILKIGTDRKQNGSLDREAMILKIMREEGLKIERENTETGKHFNYHFFFPEVIESFISTKQEKRRINILGFPEDIEMVKQLTPMSAITASRKRVDPRTSVWMAGKALKTIGFANSLGIANRSMTFGNLLLEKTLHGVIIFDWTQAEIFPDGIVPAAIRSSEIAQVATWVLTVLGGDPKKGNLPPDKQLEKDTGKEYENYLLKLARGEESDANKARDDFYKLAFHLWGDKFWKYTEYDLI